MRTPLVQLFVWSALASTALLAAGCGGSSLTATSTCAQFAKANSSTQQSIARMVARPEDRGLDDQQLAAALSYACSGSDDRTLQDIAGGKALNAPNRHPPGASASGSAAETCAGNAQLLSTLGTSVARALSGDFRALSPPSVTRLADEVTTGPFHTEFLKNQMAGLEARASAGEVLSESVLASGFTSGDCQRPEVLLFAHSRRVTSAQPEPAVTTQTLLVTFQRGADVRYRISALTIPAGKLDPNHAAGTDCRTSVQTQQQAGLALAAIFNFDYQNLDARSSALSQYLTPNLLRTTLASEDHFRAVGTANKLITAFKFSSVAFNSGSCDNFMAVSYATDGGAAISLRVTATFERKAGALRLAAFQVVN